MTKYRAQGNKRPFMKDFEYMEQISIGDRVQYSVMGLESGQVVIGDSLIFKSARTYTADTFIVQKVQHLPEVIVLIGDWT